MDPIIEKIVQKLQSLPESKVLTALDFVDGFFMLERENSVTKLPEPGQQGDRSAIETRGHEELEATLDRLADKFKACIGASPPSLSDRAISRAGIYGKFS